MKRFFSLLLALTMLLSLAACGDGASGASSESDPQGEGAPKPVSVAGRYVETDITPSGINDDPDAYGMVTHLWAREDGALDLLAYTTVKQGADDQYEDTMRWYHSDNRGDDWEERELPGWEEITDWLIDSQGTVYGFGYGEDGKLVEHRQMADGTEDQMTVELGLHLTKPTLPIASEDTSADGEAAAEEEADMDETFIGLTSFFQEKYYLMSAKDTQGKVSLYAVNLADGTLAWSYTPDKAQEPCWTAVGDLLYVSDMSDMEYLNVVLDGATGEVKESFDLEKLHGSLSNMQATAQGAYYYFGDGNDFCRGIFGQEQVETILEADEYRYGAEAEDGYLNGRCFGVLSDGTIYINAGNESKIANLYRYDFDKEAAGPEETLTLWSLEEYATLRQAILSFREVHPEVKVDYQVPDLDTDGKTLNDVLTSLNTKMLSGEGPDILILDGIGYENYAEKGVLADLTDVYQGKEFVGQTVSKLLDEKGRCYVIPARFTIPAIFGAGLKAPDTLEALAKAVTAGGKTMEETEWEVDEDGNYHMKENQQKDEDKPYFSMDFSMVSDILWQSSAPALLNGDGLQEENLRQWLETLKTISDYYGYFDNNEDGDGLVSIASGQSMGYGNQNVYTEEAALQWEMAKTQTGTMQLGAVEGLVTTIDSARQLKDSTGGFTVAQFPGLTEGAYSPEILMAVSAASKQRELAMEFVETALSMAVQQYTYGDGLGVLQEAMDKQLAYFASYTDPYGWDIQELQALCDSRTTPVITNQEEQDVIVQAAKDYCKGATSLDEAVQAVRDKLALKLAEQ